MVETHPKELTEVSGDEFKLVMRRFAASVNVITSANGAVKNGMTATAVCSVSADPPSALIIVNKSNRSHLTIESTKAFAVNVLSSNQRQVAGHFASKLADPFAQVPHVVGKTGCPIIEGADAHIECVVMEQLDVGTHTIFVGKIVAASAASGEPLLYHEGRYVGIGNEALAVN
jgi:flavin reductase (DIM6/NTAB) family NADH-FMN oxidoreductase RutF